MDVVIFTDLDFLSNVFFRFRTQRQSSDDRNVLNFDNVAFVLNALDVLAGDDRFVDVRKRRPTYRTLKTLDEINQDAHRPHVTQSPRTNTRSKFDDGTREGRDVGSNDELDKLRNDTTLKQIDKESRLEIFEKDIQRRLAAKRAAADDSPREAAEGTDAQADRTNSQSAVLLQDGAPSCCRRFRRLLIGLIVFFNRRSREQEGVAESLEVAAYR